MHLNYFLSKTAFLFLTPNMWPEILRRVKIKLGERLLPNLIGHDRSISEQWCHKHSISDKMFFADYFKDKNIFLI